MFFKELNLKQMASHLCARICHACPAIIVTFKSTDDSDPIILSNLFLQLDNIKIAQAIVEDCVRLPLPQIPYFCATSI
jgi:hypothetical protein